MVLCNMFCKNAEKKLDNDELFCTNCEISLKEQIEQEKSKINKSSIVIGLIMTIIGIGITIGTSFFFGPFFGCPILIIGSILLFNNILYKLKKVVKLIISISISIIICIIVIIISINVWTPNYVSKEDTLKYLNETFSLTDLTLIKEQREEYTYTLYFTNEELNGKIFLVETEFDANGEMIFKDNYIATKYDERLENQYSIYFDKIVKQNFDILVEVEDVYNIPLISYEEYIKVLNDKQLYIYLEPKIKLDKSNKSFHLKTTDSSINKEELNIANSEINKFINSNFNIQQLKEDVKNIIDLNNLNNVSNVYFNFNDCAENEYVISCSEIIELYNK